jgi:hypothetical protein
MDLLEETLLKIVHKSFFSSCNSKVYRIHPVDIAEEQIVAVLKGRFPEVSFQYQFPKNRRQAYLYRLLHIFDEEFSFHIGCLFVLQLN